MTRAPFLIGDLVYHKRWNARSAGPDLHTGQVVGFKGLDMVRVKTGSGHVRHWKAASVHNVSADIDGLRAAVNGQ